jgi:hypothetical protein
MKWLQGNVLGMVLASISGVLVLLVLLMSVVWTMPVPLKIDETDVAEKEDVDAVLIAPQVAGMDVLKVINERPVFNLSRLPVTNDTVDGAAPEMDTSVAVRAAPDVRLTGIIITPEMKIATLTPSQGGLENVMAHEGESLTGEYVGWHVGVVNPRAVVLKSSDGQSLELDLQVHDMKIKEPPKPIMPAAVAQTASAQAAQALGEDGQPLSRAEQIRQRIAERREELRLQQEEAQAQNQEEPKPPPDRSAYQNAIRNLMNSKRKDQSSNDKEDG